MKRGLFEMAFLTFTNLFAMFFALVLFIVISKIFLERKKEIREHAMVMPIILAGIMLLLAIPGFLKGISFLVPYIALGVIGLALFIFAFKVMGVPDAIILPQLKKNFGIIFKIVLVLMIFLGAGMAFGEDLLNKGKSEPTGASVIDFIEQDEKMDIELNIKPLFARSFLGLAFIFVLVGGLIYFIQKLK